MSKRDMFDYVRTVLENVSFDPQLFYKELEKAIAHLLPYDLERLTSWVSVYVQGKPELESSLVLLEQ